MASNSTDHAATLHTIHVQGDRVLLGVLWVHALYALALAPWHGTWTEAVTVSLAAAGVPTLLHLRFPGERVTRVSVAVAAMVFSALVIHQAHGMIEMHFGIFALLALLLYYRDWLVIAAGAATTALHHVAFNYLQVEGYGVYIFTHTGWEIVGAHAGYVVVQAGLLCYLAILLRREAEDTQDLDAMARGIVGQDGRTDLTYRRADARGQVAQNLNRAIAGIHEQLKGMRDDAQRLDQVAEQMASSSERASQSLEQQSSEVEQVATAMEEMTATTREVAHSTQQASTAAREAHQEASSGQQVVRETVEWMEALTEELSASQGAIQRTDEQSEKIRTVLDVIRGITEQVNLLALNAAIESARAGDYGRGFSVVAEEVRKLAQQTQNSTDEIAGMIQGLTEASSDAVQRVEKSVERSGQARESATRAGDALTRISEAASRIDELNEHIASAAEEQSATADEISARITSVRSGAETVSGDSEQSQETARSLRELSQRLNRMVDAFRVE